MAHSKKFNFALGVLVIGAGATLGDADHILPPYTRAWGHLAIIPGAILFSLAITYCGRRLGAWLLNKLGGGK